MVKTRVRVINSREVYILRRPYRSEERNELNEPTQTEIVITDTEFEGSDFPKFLIVGGLWLFVLLFFVSFLMVVLLI